VYEFCLAIEKVYLAQWVRGIRKDERYADYSRILGLIESSKKPEDVIKNIAYDEDAIREAVGRSNMYGAGFCKYVLLRLELVTAEHDALREFDAKSIEHAKSAPIALDKKQLITNRQRFSEILLVESG